MKNKEISGFSFVNKLLIVVSLIQVIPCSAFNTESAMIYNFGHKIAKQPSPKKFAKTRLSSKNLGIKIAAVRTQPQINIPKSKTSPILKSPLVLKPRKRGSLPLKATPKFGSVPVQSTVNADYLYNGLLSSDFYFDYKSTTFTFSQNSVNITAPLDPKHYKN